MHILIVDDEEAARVGLEKLLIRFTDNKSVIEMASNVNEAVQMIEKKNFNLVFLDGQWWVMAKMWEKVADSIN